MLSDRDSYVRRFARRSLLELATRSTPNAYLPALQSKDRTTQVVAALALARLNDGRGLDILLAEVANPLGIERVEVFNLPSASKTPALSPPFASPSLIPIQKFGSSLSSPSVSSATKTPPPSYKKFPLIPLPPKTSASPPPKH
jgi:hypothetical protein